MGCNPVIPISLHKEAKILLIVINQVPETLLVHKLDFHFFILESHYPKFISVIPISDLTSVIPISLQFQTGFYPVIPNCFPVIPLSQIPLSGPYEWGLKNLIWHKNKGGIYG